MTEDRPGPRRTRAVSDVIAFVFVFSIIITSVGLVTVVGFSVLDDLQAGEQALNAERAFQSLGHNLGNVERSHAPGRAGEVQLNDGALYVRENSGITVEVTGPDQQISRDLGTLYYSMQDRETNITLEGGAAFREDRFGDPIMIAEPNFRCDTGGSDPNVAMISIVTLTSSDTIPGGSGTVQVVAREQSQTLPISIPEGDTGGNTAVTVTITNSRFTEAWDDYLTDNGWSSTGTNQWTCSGQMDIYVRHTRVDIAFVTG